MPLCVTVHAAHKECLCFSQIHVCDAQVFQMKLKMQCPSISIKSIAFANIHHIYSSVCTAAIFNSMYVMFSFMYACVRVCVCDAHSIQIMLKLRGSTTMSYNSYNYATEP